MEKVNVKDVITANIVNEHTGKFRISVIVNNRDSKYLDENAEDGTAYGYLLTDGTLTKDKDNSELDYVSINEDQIPLSAGVINVSSDIIASLTYYGYFTYDEE